LEENMNSRSPLPVPALASTRRQWLTGAAITFGALATTAARASADTPGGISRTAESIHQETIFKASPKRIYDALLDSKQFQQIELLGQAMKPADLDAKPAKISREPGGSFSIFGDYIIGRQIELVPDKRIVQAWRELSWDPGVYSLVKFELIPEGTGTKLVFDHTAFPIGAADHLASGWKSHYWEPLDKLLT
jgi:activator of HSP90 ATPase